MIKLIIIIVIGILVSQIQSAIKKKQEQDKKTKQEPLRLIFNDQSDQETPVNEIKRSPDIQRKIKKISETISLEPSNYDKGIFSEPYKPKSSDPKSESKPKRKQPIVSFTPKGILQGIIISEILKRPKY
jgi:DUF4097 and DUF4098 domain-containing protein YvlB